jgi:hypothetical protein
MRADDARAAAVGTTLPPIRIRHLLLIGLVLAVFAEGVPRLRAAWELHSQASTFANYALCMVGPTGPASLRDNPAVFWTLVRRRVVTSRAEEQPFASCASAAAELTGSLEIQRAHGAKAADFVEFGGVAADRAQAGSTGELTIASLLVTTEPLARLAERGAPFVRGGYTPLVRATSHAREAVHPVELPHPSTGSGLPPHSALYEGTRTVGDRVVLTRGQGTHRAVYRSEDGGLTWTASSMDSAVRHIAGRCPTGETGASFLFGVSDDGRFKTVRSLSPDGSESRASLAERTSRVFAASCDESVMAVALGQQGSREVTLQLCRFDGRCGAVELPKMGDRGPEYPVDVARVRGVTVLSTSMHGIVRVSSSRDDGVTWTPFVVAYDPRAHAELEARTAPVQLLVLESRLMLFGGGASPRDPYPVLFSDDFGASWYGS